MVVTLIVLSKFNPLQGGASFTNVARVGWLSYKLKPKKMRKNRKFIVAFMLISGFGATRKSVPSSND